MKWIQKVVVNGSSAQVTIPRALLFRLKTRPGRFVEITHDDDAESFSVRVWEEQENGTRRSPGLITSAPEMPR